MENIYALAIFAIIWFGVVPPSVAALATDIAEEKVAEAFLAWIDRRFRGGMIGYFFRCPICLSHWILILLALGLWKNWGLLPFDRLTNLIIAILAVFADVRITRLWLK